MKQLRGVQLVQHMIQQVAMRQSDLSKLRLSCSIEIAREIAEELVELQLNARTEHTVSTLQRRLKRGEPALVAGDRILGATVVNVFEGSPGLAWVAAP